MELEIPEGVESFNLWTIVIMARLWDDFPRPQYFYCSPGGVAVAGDRALPGAQIGPDGATQVEHFRNTMNWLINERFVRGTANGWGEFAEVSLTKKGFSVLSQVPQSIAGKPAAPQKPLGILIREATVSSTVGMLAALIQSMLQQSAGHH